MASSAYDTDCTGAKRLQELHLDAKYDSIDSNSDLEDDEVPKLPIESKAKRLNDAAFEDFVSKNQRELSSRPAEKGGSGDKQASVARMFQHHEDKKIIASPREYQLELFERAKQRNTIVVLDTGSGKTLVAALLLRHVLDRELEDRAQGKDKRVSFFLVEKIALCFQQHAVLKSNLEHPMAMFCGDMSGIMRTKEFWDKKFGENMVVVCTAQILLDCLNRGFIQMAQINLLIFDEAHHTKKQHPYARIIKDHYMRMPDMAARPRVLGMTASPVDAQTRDVRASALELESMLCSEIATVSDDALAQAGARRAFVEVQETYEQLPFPEDSKTELWERIARHVLYNPQFAAAFEFTKEASASLGGWCADQFWKLLAADDEIARLVARTERDHVHEFASLLTEKAVDAVKEVKKIIAEHEPVEISPASDLLSSKTKALHGILDDAFRRGTSRCIIFVEKRHTAMVLADLFQQRCMTVPGMNVAYMVGTQRSGVQVGNMSFPDQVLMLAKFKRGEINCVFATTVAEEGIDIPECDLVIRFDLYNSMIQYLQSKGRARQANSRYISMVEEGNMRHRRLLLQAARDAHALRRFCASLPEDRRLQDDRIDAEAAVKYEQASQKYYEVSSTGARLTFANSLDVLGQFVSSLQAPGHEMSLRPDYIVTTSGPKFLADVILPDCSPIKSIPGYPQRSKLLAKCSAAFELCLELLRSGYIDGHFQSMLKKQLPLMRNARLAVSSSKRDEYNMLLRPAMWSDLGSEAPTELFITTISFASPEALKYPSKPLLLLSRKQLPDLPLIPLFFGNERNSEVRLHSSPQPITVDRDQFETLAAFTLKLFSDVFSKDFAAKPHEIPYYLAPCVETHAEAIDGSQTHLDWTAVEAAQKQEWLAWENAADDFFHDKLVIDPLEGSRKLIIHGINPNLRPSDPTPAGAPEPRSRAYRLVKPTIKEYSNSLYPKARKISQWREDQPVVDAELLPLRRNFLDEFYVDEKNTKCSIILEPLRVSPIPVEVVSTVMAFPAIIYRLDTALVALDACSLLNLKLPPALALEALTKDSDNSGDHGEEQVNFQAGMGSNYERLEFLGDSFLKMATTIAIFTCVPEGNEFDYHVERMVLICNRNLFNNAVADTRKLPEYVRSRAFDRRTWYPSLALAKGKQAKSAIRHSLADKSIADVCEALIGAAYLTKSESGHEFDMAVRAVSRMVNPDEAGEKSQVQRHTMDCFADYYTAFKPPAWHMAPSSAAQRFAVEEIAKATNYTFKSAPLLRSAFKHPSYPYEDTVPHYQRLEFLGDALLDMVIVDYLFKRFPDADPQWLTEHKMAMASNAFLACIAVKLKLHKHLLSTTPSLLSQIHEYETDLKAAEEKSHEEEDQQTKDGSDQARRRDFWVDVPNPPKTIADVTEALVGAMFVDSQYDYSVVTTFFTRFIQPFFENMAVYDTFAQKHPVTLLSTHMSHVIGCSQWRFCSKAVPCGIDEGTRAVTDSDMLSAVLIHGEVFAHHTAQSGRYAKVAVAKKAMEKVLALGDAKMARAAMQCDCRGRSDE